MVGRKLDYFWFEVLHRSRATGSRARVGRIHTPHGHIDTPGFVPVGTNATLKCIDSQTADACGAQLMFCNSYHLMLHPGTSIVKEMGGLHKFMGRRTRPLITDSGGFQVFSMQAGAFEMENVGLKAASVKNHPSTVIKIDDEGVTFKSYRDGKLVRLTPEVSVLAQKDLGADIIIPFDYLPPYNATQETLERSVKLSHQWETKSLDVHLRDRQNQAMYCVIHGGLDKRLRLESVDYLSKLPFDGIAIGGSLGETREDMLSLLEYITPHLPQDLPVHLLGIGDRWSIAHSVAYGIDTFDSSYPTKLARHGSVFYDETTHLLLKKGTYRNDASPISPNCDCPTCENFSRSYLHHLLKANEPTAQTLLSIHNLHMMMNFMELYRKRILNDEV